MAPRIVISYDGTNNEDDAVALGAVFAKAGAEVSLAYVQHPTPTKGSRHEVEPQSLLARGARLLGDEAVDRHVITDRSTPAGLRSLAERIGAEAIVFCSDSHTAPGHIAIGNSAQRLLEGGSCAIAIAPAVFARRGQSGLRRIAAVGGDSDASVATTASSLATAMGAEVTVSADENADLLVVGSRPEAHEGRVSISASVQNLIEISTCPILVVARAAPLSFSSHLDAVPV